MRKKIFFTLILSLLISQLPLYAKDMRADYQAVEKQRNALLEKARREAEQADKEAEERHRKIVSDRAALQKAIRDLKEKNTQLEKKRSALEKSLGSLKEKEAELKEKLAETEAVNNELSGFIRGNAKDLSSLITHSPQSALENNRDDFLAPLIHQAGRESFPSMKDIRRMADLLFDEVRLSGEVRLTRGIIVDRSGREVEAELLLLGSFTAVYNFDGETGFLLYSEQSRRLFALSKLPDSSIAAQNEDYMTGEAEGVFLDISKGGALRQLTHKMSLTEQIPKGGPIVWPILILFGLAVIIVIERTVFLWRRRCDADAFTTSLCAHAEREDWDGCKKLCNDNSNKSVPEILKAGINCRGPYRLDMENALQESILREIPLLERFMSTLGMLAAIAPLLGLLGTVTGMINTFHVITYYGTGDPRMMSGGISEALVTTMLGLSVAIPVMLAHTLLSRRIETEIGLMEEKAVSFVNTVFKNKTGEA